MSYNNKQLLRNYYDANEESQELENKKYDTKNN